MAGDHKCPVCQATFTRPQHVARHMRSRTFNPTSLLLTTPPPPPPPLPTATPPPLGPSSLIPSSQIPAIAHTSVSIVEISSLEGLYSDPFIMFLPSPAVPLC